MADAAEEGQVKVHAEDEVETTAAADTASDGDSYVQRTALVLARARWAAWPVSKAFLMRRFCPRRSNRASAPVRTAQTLTMPAATPGRALIIGATTQ